MDRSRVGSGVPVHAQVALEKHARWCDGAELALRDTLGSDRNHIVDSVNAGRLELWSIDGGELWAVTNVEAGSGELVVCCVQGRGMARFAELFYRIAQANGLRSVRFFSSRPALAKRLLKRYRFRCLGSVYQCEVGPRVTQ
jgi:hypothetical protein